MLESSGRARAQKRNAWVELPFHQQSETAVWYRPRPCAASAWPLWCDDAVEVVLAEIHIGGAAQPGRPKTSDGSARAWLSDPSRVEER